MRTRPLPVFAAILLLSTALVASVSAPADAARRRQHESPGHQLFASPQAAPIAISADGAFVYVANTTSNTVSTINTATGISLPPETEVGLEPVGLAVRPDGLEVWVANHVSDSVSVIDTNPASASYRKVVETVQDLDGFGVTRFDEPVGVAFTEDGKKAYVSLSSRNEIAVVDTSLCDTPCSPYEVVDTLAISAQEPRAIAVRKLPGGQELLFVSAFESHNRSELSACLLVSPPQCTLDFNDLIDFATNPNLPGRPKNIVENAAAPDRDVFVFDTATDTEIAAISDVGTLLYGLAVDSQGRVFVSQTDARNMENGLEGENLIDLDNRMFSNEIAFIDCSAGGASCSFNSASDAVDLEPATPTPATALSTPYGIAVSGDTSTLVATAAGSSRLFTVDRATRSILGRVDVGAIPRGVALRSDVTGAPQTAYVLNTLGNSVSVVDVSTPGTPAVLSTIQIGFDPTPEAVRLGRIAFNNAFASTNGTFSCASCHPDGNTDQLLWRIGGACSLSGCTGDDEPRTTMPVRGLKHTLPLHWDGTLGDPFGGGNGEVGVGGSGGTDCALGDADSDHDCFLDLVNASLSGVMCDQTGSCPGTELSVQEQDDMATFLASVVYPPARSRRMDDSVSLPGDGIFIGPDEASALEGFKDFFTDQGGSNNPNTCADSNAGCHELPLGASTNSATLNGFDAPTMRGMTDRWLQFSLGVTQTQTFLSIATSGINFPPFVVAPMEDGIAFDPAVGFTEVSTLGVAFIAFEQVYNTRPIHTIQMFEEASTGFPGATGRQVTLNTVTTTGGNLAATEALMLDLEAADMAGLVNLRAVGIRNGAPITLSYRGTALYKKGPTELTHAQMISEAQAGTLLMTLTAALPQNYGKASHPQPLLGTDGTGSGTTGDPPLPRLTSGGGSNPPSFDVSGIDVRSDAIIFVDGVEVSGTLTCIDGTTGDFCNDGTVEIDLDSRPSTGLHLLQVQNPSGPLSNEIPLCIGNSGNCT